MVGSGDLRDPVEHAIAEIEAKYKARIKDRNKKITKLKLKIGKLNAEIDKLKEDYRMLEYDVDYYRGFSHGGERW